MSTTISTHPIDQVTFPQIYICPPENTVTNLNYDIINTNNVTLNSSQIYLLYDLVNEKIEEAESKKFMAGLNAFEEENRYMNWYMGVTEFRQAFISNSYPDMKETIYLFRTV